MSSLESFSNEIFYEIFDRMCFKDIYYAFYGINTRFNYLIENITKAHIGSLRKYDVR